MVLPVGVDPQIFAGLKQSLRTMLIDSGQQRFASSVPGGAAGAVADLHFTAGSDGVLRWTYVNRGDYDQNSEVNGADIAPIAAHFRTNTASSDWLSKAVAVDGDGNGEVNGADIVPIAGNFRSKVDGYRIEVSASGAGGWSEAATVLFGANTADGAWRVFTLTLAGPVHESWYRVVPYSGSEFGAPSNAVQYGAPLPQVISVAPLSGREGSSVQLAAVVSGPAPDTYDWDFGGGASPDTSSEQSPSVTLGAHGSYSASLMVSNALGADTFDFTLTVNPNQPPTASFSADPQSGSPGATVELDASASFDPDADIVHYEWDLDGDQNFETDGGASPLFTTTLPDPAGAVDVSLRVTDDSGATDIATLTLSSVNQPPSASFTATPQTGDPGEAVILDASASSDPDGTIVQYEWDLDGDGSYEIDAGTNPIANTTLPNPAGPVNVSLRVTDNEGATDEMMLTLSSLAGGDWLIVTLDSTGAGSYNSLAAVNGNPAVSYTGNDELKYVRASNADGSAWGAPQAIDSVGSAGGHTSLKVVNGFPAISYCDDTTKDLKFIRASDAHGGAWNAPQTPDSTGDVGYYSSLALVNGIPAISYLDDANGDLKYVRASNADGSAWGSPQSPDSDGYVGVHTSLAMVNGFPAISYSDLADGDLMYVRAGDADGDAWGAPQTLDSTGIVGWNTSLAVVSGRPAISYYKLTGYELRYMGASDADGSDWGAPQTVADSGDESAHTSLAEVNGKGAISYFNSIDGNLKYAVLMP